MKRTSVWLLLATLLASVGCLKEEAVNESLSYSLNATVEGLTPETRAGFDLDNDAKFFWTKGDAIAVGTGNPYYKFTTDAKTGSATATFTGSGEPTGYAVYPFGGVKSINGNELTYEFAREYRYNTVDTDFFSGMSVDLPMWAVVEDNNAMFKHLGGVIAFKFPNLGQGNDQTFTVTADQKISGRFTVDMSSEKPVIETVETGNEAEKIVTIKFSLSQSQDAVFYVPVPVGTYSLTAVLKNGDKKYEMTVGGLEVIRTGIRYKTVTEHTLQGGTEGTVSDESQVKEAMESSTDVVLTGVDGIDSTIEMPKKADGAAAEHTLTISTIANNTNTLTIAEEAESEDGENSIEKLTVEIPENYLKSLVIDMPETSVTLLPNGNTVSLNEVTATTAENTLNVGANLKIGKIIVNKGKVHLKAGAKVNEIVRGEGNTDVVKVTFEGSLPSNITFREGVVVCNENGDLLALDAATAQSALDNAAEGTTIKLTPGVNYGILYMRPIKGAAMTKTVDWIDNYYGFESYSLFENITILGAEGATIDAIQIEGGFYYNTPHSQSDKYPVMLSLIELKNVIIDGVTFTGKGGYDPQGYGNVINLSGTNIKVDGLTLQNCVLKNPDNNARILYKTESTTFKHEYSYDEETFTFFPSLEDITITGCTFNGGYMGLELRETENVTITNNVFNVGDRNILLAANTGCTFTGEITITGNISNNAKERFVRGDGTGDAVVVISGNTINNYQSEDKDYIKVTNGNNITIENNTINAENANQLAAAFKIGGNAVLVNDIALASSISINNANFVLNGNGNTITMTEDGTNSNALFDIIGGKATIQNVTFDGIKGGAVVRTVDTEFNADGVTVQNCQHTVAQGLFRLMGKSTISNSTFSNNNCTMVISNNFDATDGDEALNEEFKLDNCVFENNSCSTTGVVYYAGGAAATINGNKFLNNNVTTSNGATVYMGFKKNCTITNNIFDGNTVTATSKRSSGGLMIGNAATVTGNCFVNNTVTVNGETGYGNDVCASPYYAAIDLSGNYWGGGAPVKGDDYYQEYDNNEVIINDYLTEYQGY